MDPLGQSFGSELSSVLSNSRISGHHHPRVRITATNRDAAVLRQREPVQVVSTPVPEPAPRFLPAPERRPVTRPGERQIPSRNGTS